jgi:hypothetical protein
MQSQGAQPDPTREIAREPSSFRDAFSRARLAALESTGFDEPQSVRAGMPTREHRHGQVAAARTFEVRIEKREGKRKRQVAAWNAIGRDGWELVAVTDRHGFFRRERTERDQL